LAKLADRAVVRGINSANGLREQPALTATIDPKGFFGALANPPEWAASHACKENGPERGSAAGPLIFGLQMRVESIDAQYQQRGRVATVR
jgi:hypothetical protein